MRDFIYSSPTKVFFGADTQKNIGEILLSFGAKKVLIHYGGHSAVASGLLQQVIDSLEQVGLGWVGLGGVSPNPRLSMVYQGIALCRQESVDFLLAVGGGSVIDSAKAIAYGLATEGDVWDFFSGATQPVDSFPVGCILTIAAAGSETSNSCVITNDKTGLKRACDNELGRCRFAVMNPALTLTLSAYQTQCGCADILMHTMERYFHSGEALELTDTLAQALMRSVMDWARVLVKQPDHSQARAEIMWAGSLSHNGLMACGGGNGDWATHLIEHELSGVFDVAHGAGLTAVWGSWARYVSKKRPDRFVQFAVQVMGIDPLGKSQQQVALDGIKATEAFWEEIGLPCNLAQLGLQLSQEQLDALADQCTDNNRRQIGDVVFLDRQAVREIYQAARGSSDERKERG